MTFLILGSLAVSRNGNPIVTSKSHHSVIVCELKEFFLLPAAAMVAWHHSWRTFRFKVTTEEKEG